MAWIKVSDRLPKKDGKYKIKADVNPLSFVLDEREVEGVPFSLFNNNPVFHMPKGWQIKEWFEEE